MKKFDDLMHDIDEKVDKKIGPAWAFLQKYFVLFSASLLAILFAIFLYRVFHNRPYVLTTVIKSDLANIENILRQIDKECNILDIRQEAALIDFLTVEKFTGSTIGCLNLAYPAKWRGPYMSVNPTVQTKFYQIVRSREGFFVIPGKGVTLPNGLVIGKDIVITPEVSIKQMLLRGGRLNYLGEALGFQIGFKIGDWDKRKPSEDALERANEVLKEFNEALPFAQFATTQKVAVC